MLLGIDIGTSGAKAILLDESGVVVAKAFTPYPLASPKPLWSEQNPEDWWDATIQSIRSLIAFEPRCAKDIAAVGLTGQMHGLVMLDATGAVLRPCILWNDQRSSDQCAGITARIGLEKLLEVTGKPVLPSFTLPKVLWVSEEEPDVYRNCAKVVLPKDYIRYRLSGTFFTDVADASGTSMFDVGRRDWSYELLTELRIAADWMPAVSESHEMTSFINAEGSRETGLLAGTPIVAGAGDQAAEAIGCGILHEGSVSVTIGTSGVVFAATGAYIPDASGRLHAYCHARQDTWHLMGVMLSAGGSLKWYKDTFGDLEQSDADERGVDVYDVLSEDASTAPAGCEGLFFLPYLTGERTPHADPYARAAFIGATLRHGKDHFTRAVLEGVAFGLRDSMELMKKMSITIDHIRVSGGGTRSWLWRQIMADVFRQDIHMVNVVEGAAFGAALLAGVGAGVFKDIDDACDQTVLGTGFTIPGTDAGCYDSLYPCYRSLYRALKDEYRSIADVVAHAG